MKRLLVLATTLYGFILLSKLIDRRARRDIPSSGGHARDARSMPLHRSVPTLRRMVFFRRIKFLLTATFVRLRGLHCWGDVLRM